MKKVDPFFILKHKRTYKKEGKKMSRDKVFETLQLIKNDKRYNVFVDLETLDSEEILKIDPENYSYMIIEHNPYQPLKELALQGLLFIGFMEFGYFQFKGKRKKYPIEMFSKSN